MLMLFSLIVMRMTGAFSMNPIFGRSNVPVRVRAMFIMVFSFLIYSGTNGVLNHEPTVLAEYIFLLLKEFLYGFTISFGMELSFLVVRFASAYMDHSMGLSMAQIYDPQYNTQMTVTSGMYYACIVLLLFATDGHVRLIEMFYKSAELVPFGEVALNRQLPLAMLSMFEEAIVMGTQLAIPLLAMELVAEAAIGILVRVIPQLNVFSINFQLKIIVGMFMILFLFSPMASKLYTILDWMFESLEDLTRLLR